MQNNRIEIAGSAEFIRPGTGLKMLEKAYLCVMKNAGRLSKGQMIMLRDEINKEVMK